MQSGCKLYMMLWAALLAILTPLTTYAQSTPSKHEEPFIGNKWIVEGYVGEKRRLSPENMLGKTQAFRKDWAKGTFFDCIYGGFSSTYTAYALDAFLANREFRVFARYRDELALTEQVAFVHRISCARGPRILYPFVTFQPHGRAMLLFEDVIYILK